MPLTSQLFKYLEAGLGGRWLTIPALGKLGQAQGQHCFKNKAKQKQEIALGPPFFSLMAASSDPFFQRSHFHPGT